jgi:DNA replication protein DnaC
MEHLPRPSNISGDDEPSGEGGHEHYPWTQDRIYRPPHDKPRLDPDGTRSRIQVLMPPRVDWNEVEQARVNGKTTYGRFTEEFFQELLRETEMLYIDEITPLTSLEENEVEAGRPCPRCFHGAYYLRLRGKVTGIITQVRVTCPCEVIKSINVWFHNPSIVPQRYWGAKLATLQPVEFPTSLLPVDQQREIISILRNDPTRSFLLCGGTRRGKTHFSMALFHEALKRWAIAGYGDLQLSEISVFRTNTKRLLDEHVAWASRKPGQRIELPSITVERIGWLAKQGNRPCLYLDEIDKVNMTQFKITVLFELVDAISQVHGQIVAVSNAQYDKLRELWGKYDDTAAAILSRICFEGERGAIIDFGK